MEVLEEGITWDIFLASPFYGRENELYWESGAFHLKIAPAEHENIIMFNFFFLNIKNILQQKSICISQSLERIYREDVEAKQAIVVAAVIEKYMY